MSGVGPGTPLVGLAISVVLGFLLPLGAASTAVGYGRRHGGTLPNYRGVPVPLGLGWAWAVWGIGVWAAAGAGSGMLVAGVAVLGRIDDRFGDRGTSGFRGHLSALGRGRVTTGLLKVGGIGALALLATWPVEMSRPATTVARVLGWLAAAAVIALSANLVNLLDRRPGRALKSYVLLAAVPVIVMVLMQLRRGAGAASVPGAIQVVVLSFGPVLATWYFDVTERGMLGDMGANAAGALAGWLLVAVLSLPGVVVAAGLLLALNLASERVSFSAVIEGNRVLRRLDGLGRPQRRDGAGTVASSRNGDVI